jgi:monovalent cation:H+ antiporter, CPA1 family
MSNHIFFDIIISLSIILLIANIAYIFSKKISSIPFPIILVILGIFLSSLNIKILNTIELTPELVLYIFLPILLFESAFNFDFRVFKRIITPAFLFATVGLLIASNIVAFGLYFVIGIDYISAFLFGTIISSTDPVAILTLLKKLGVPIKLNLLIDAESFFNDATSLVIFKIISLILFSQSSNLSTESIISTSIINFVYITFGGILLGLLIGVIFSKFIGFINNAKFVEIGTTLIVAFLSFAIGEEIFEVSGVLAVLISGLVIGNYGRSKFSPNDFETLVNIWDFLVFLTTVLVFILIGFKISIESIVNNIPTVAFIILIILIARSFAIYIVGEIYNIFTSKNNYLSLSWLHILNWGGLRGVLPLALILALPDNYVFKDLFLTMGYGVVLFTLVINGISTKFLVQKLNLDNLDRTNQLEINIIELLILKKLKKHLNWLLEIKEISKEVFDEKLEKLHKQKKELLNSFKISFSLMTQEVFDKESKRILFKYCLKLEEKSYLHLYTKKVISEPIYGKLIAKSEQQIEAIDLDNDQFKEKSKIQLNKLILSQNMSFSKKYRMHCLVM